MRVPLEPTAFPSGRSVYVFYELNLRNFMARPLSLNRLEVLDPDLGSDGETSQPIATFAEHELEGWCNLWAERRFLTAKKDL
jgi:hypothetical protein